MAHHEQRGQAPFLTMRLLDLFGSSASDGFQCEVEFNCDQLEVRKGACPRSFDLKQDGFEL